MVAAPSAVVRVTCTSLSLLTVTVAAVPLAVWVPFTAMRTSDAAVGVTVIVSPCAAQPTA